MKTLRSIAVILFLAATFTVSAFAQAAAQPGTAKIAVINTLAFDDTKAGITKYVTAMNSLENEFKADTTQLQGMQTRLQGLAKEIQTFQQQAASGGKVPVDQKTAQAKVDEAEKLQRDYKFKQEDAKARFERRQQAIINPVLQDIYKAVQEFAKQRGYTMILDVAKLAQNDIIMALDEKADVTKEFITFYNARPAGTAAAATRP